MIVYDTIGTHYRAATLMGLDWRGFVPVIDPDSLMIVDVADTTHKSVLGSLRFVGIAEDGTLLPGGRDAAVRIAPRASASA